MPKFSRALDVYQGFNFKKDKQNPVGYILKLKVAGQEVKADQETIKDPLQPDKALADKVVAVLNHVLWNTGVTDAFYFSGQISTANKQQLSSMLLGTMVDMTVEFKFCIYEYDPLAKKYFKSMVVDKDLKGLIEKNGSELNIAVADDPSHEVQSPKNFTLQIGIKPQNIEQTVTLATASGKNIVKQWGVTEAKGK